MTREIESKNKLIRCFIALELSRDAIDEIEEIQGLIRKKGFFYGKFTDPENLHLTLKFIGEIDEQKIEEVKERLKNIKRSKFEVSLGELGFFSENVMRILWLKLNGEQIWALQKEIDEKLKDIFLKEERFMSHITLARIRKVVKKNELIGYIKNLKHRKINFIVREFCFKKSELKIEGPVYSDLEKYILE